MDLGFKRYQETLRRTARGYLEKACSLDNLRAAGLMHSRAEAERKQGMSLDNRSAERHDARIMKRPVTSRCPPWSRSPGPAGPRRWSFRNWQKGRCGPSGEVGST